VTNRVPKSGRKTLKTAAQIPRIGPFMVSQVGWRKATRCAQFIAAWGAAYEDLHLGRAVTIDEVAAHWGKSRAMVFRDFQIYKEVWPRDVTPLRVWKWCRAQSELAGDRDDVAAQLWNVPVVS
jgi:hypothetical protein